MSSNLRPYVAPIEFYEQEVGVELMFDMFYDDGQETECEHPIAPVDGSTDVDIIVKDNTSSPFQCVWKGGNTVSYVVQVGDFPVAADEVIHYYEAYLKYRNPSFPVGLEDATLHSEAFVIAVIKRPTTNL